MPRKPGMSGSEGGRRKRTSSTGTSSAAYPTSRRDLWEPGGEVPPGDPTVTHATQNPNPTCHPGRLEKAPYLVGGISSGHS